MSLSLRFQCVQEDLEVVKQVVLLKTQVCLGNCLRKAEFASPNTSLFNLLRFNEPRYLAQNLSLLSFRNIECKILLSAHDDLTFYGFMYQGSRTQKRHILIGIVIDIETLRHTHNRSCNDVCVPTFLCQTIFGSSKCGLKYSVKLQQSKGLLWSRSRHR